MIKNITTLVCISMGILSFSACTSDKKTDSADTTSIQTKTETTVTESPKQENAPTTTAYNAIPDSAILGKEKEALVKVKELNAVALQDAEGKSTGSELTVKLLLTNKSKLDAKKFFTVSSSDARLELEGGTSIAASSESGKSSPDPESSTEATWVFKLPADAAPKKLNFFLDGTRVSVAIAKK